LLFCKIKFKVFIYNKDIDLISSIANYYIYIKYRVVKVENNSSNFIDNISIVGKLTNEYQQILNESSLRFLSALTKEFRPKIKKALEQRKRVQEKIDNGYNPTFLEKSQEILDNTWTGAKIPEDIQDRRVEITGPVDRKMIINALNSGANVFMADFEDSNAPTWDNNMMGQINLHDAVNRNISFTNENGKYYKLNSDGLAVIMVRPRGLHLVEKHILLNNEPIPGCLMDFGLYLFHNHKALHQLKSGPYYYIPKLQNHQEARLWNEIINFSEDYLKIDRGTVKVTLLIEHILASFEIEEIIFELKDHIVGLNCGRWDYIFSFIKTFRKRKEFLLPDRSQVGMNRHFLKSYVDILIQICHKRNIHAMGGMAAQIPIKNDEEANNLALSKVNDDKLREVEAGHDGTWVAHPGLIKIAKDVFDKGMPTANQIHVKKEKTDIIPSDLLKVPEGTITEVGIRSNITVGLQYMTAWISGNGCVPINNLMEDAATAEISRSQLWQWVKHEAKLEDGRSFSSQFFKKVLEEEFITLKELTNDKVNLEVAKTLFHDIVLNDKFTEFLTIEAYKYL